MENNISKTSEYRTWSTMKQRCYNENAQEYTRYGLRGVTVCDRWKNSFKNFLYDMGYRTKGMSLDRINSDGNYEPSNCRWATNLQQNCNKRGNQNSTSKYKGVDYRKSRNKFRARIKINEKQIAIGHYEKEEIAAIAYNIAAWEAWGKDSYLNEVII